MDVVNKVIRPTEVVRRLMRAHGAPAHMVFTNSYEKCRTVKCYARHINRNWFARELLELFTQLGFGCPQIYGTESYTDFRDTRAVIVRIPKSLQK